MGEASLTNILNLTRILRCFNLSSGLKINFKKSFLYGIGIEQGSATSLARVIRCKVGSFPFTYLGVPVGQNMNLVKNWNIVLEKISNRLSSWKQNSLSFGGRITLAKSILSSIPLYYMSLFRAPRHVINSIEVIRRRFCWGGTPGKSKISWVAWPSMLSSKENGGIGLGSIRASNLSLLLKWLWRLKDNKNALWATVIKAIHYNPRSWETFPCKKTIMGPWKNIIKTVEDLKHLDINVMEMLSCKVGDGSDALFWLDNWLGRGRLKDLYLALFYNEKNKWCVVKDRVGRDFPADLNWQWKQTPWHPTIYHMISQCKQFIPPIILNVKRDTWLWGDAHPMEFSVKAVRELIEDRLLPSNNFQIPWSTWVPIKVNVFAWRAGLDRIPSKDGLSKRGIPINPMCSICLAKSETTDHLLLKCELASSVWDKVFLWCKAPRELILTIKDILNVQDSWPFSIGHKKLLHAIFLISLWCIWKARNARCFDNKAFEPGEIFGDVKTMSYLWIKNRGNIQNLNWDS
ncbi:hypothetical protein E3N88_36122 [Mikania micrantha]|uniref:Reverse transcriptase zinc-binding domain-containing protein n=1 Tax=Mikania micrantha TaxID=192012 RepID=A0A5N6M393_9ASTR|nr:hypothetical protein E3N88_36122 [Mikania micrantha]